MRALRFWRSGPDAWPAPRDPSPSRLRYRLHRLWLTSLFRAILRTGVPAFLVAGFAAAHLMDAGNRAAIAAQIAALREAVEQRPEFMVDGLRIEGATPQVRAALAEQSPVEFPVSSFQLDLPALKAHFEAFDAVRRADLRIISDGVLNLRVEQRVPALVWRAHDGLFLIDAEGHRVAALDDPGARRDLPRIAGAGAAAAAPEALTLIAAAEPIADRLRGLERIGARRWDAVLDREQRIQLPEAGAVAALERVIALDQAQDLLERDLRAVDMRLPRRPTLRLADAATEELRRIRRIERGDRQ